MNLCSHFEDRSVVSESGTKSIGTTWHCAEKIQPLRIATKPPFPTTPLGNKGIIEPQSGETLSYLHEEPSTPEAQVLPEGYYEPMFRTPMTVPQLTPDKKTPPLGNEYSTRKINSSRSQNQLKIPRKPVPINGTTFLGSPFRPCKAADKPNSNFGSSEKPSEAPAPHVCGFCDMPLDTAFRSESIVAMSCGHYAHKECYDNLASLCASSNGKMNLTCMICGSLVGPAKHVSNLKSVNELPGSGAFDGIKTAPDSHKESTSHLTPTTSIHSDDLREDSPYKISEILTSESSQFSPLPQLQRKGCRLSLGDTLGSLSSASSSSLETTETHSILEDPLPIQPSPSPSSSCCQSPVPSDNVSCESLLMDHESMISEENTSITSVSGPSCEPLFKKISNSIFEAPCSHLIPQNSHIPDLRMSCFVAQSEEDQPNKSKAALWIESPDKEEKPTVFDIDNIISSYRNSAKDVQYAIKVKSQLKSLEYRGKRMLPAQLGILRFTGSMRVTSPESAHIDWQHVKAFLFESTLILCTEFDHVRAQFNPSKAIKNVSTDPKDPRTVIVRSSDTNEVPELHLHTESQATASLWKKALEDPKAQFPIHPAQFQKHRDDLEAKIRASTAQYHTSRTTGPSSDLILCISKTSLGSGLQIQQTIWDALKGLEASDRLALVVFSSNGTVETIPFHKPHWAGWDHVVKDLSNPRADSKSAVDSHHGEIVGEASLNSHDKAFSKAAELLKTHRSGNYTSLVFVTDENTNIGMIPKGLAYPKIPIHTIGIRENHNALALSTLAKATGGFYTYSKQIDDLGTILYRLLRAESHYVSSGVTIKMRARIGTELKNFRLATLNDRDLPKTFDKLTRTFEWNLGKIKRGDSFCLLFDVEGEILQSQPLLQWSLVYTDHLGSRHDPLSFRVCAPPQDLADSANYEELRCALELEECMFFSCKVFEGVMSSLLMENNRKAYQLLSVAMERLKDSLKREDFSSCSDCEAMIEILQSTFDGQCDAIMDHKILTKHFVLDCLQKLWLLQSRRALTASDEFEASFL